MTIKPENMKLYPGGSIKSPEWLAIREQVRARAGDCCEECWVENGAIGVRHPDNDQFITLPHGAKAGDRVVLTVGVRKAIRIVCTVAHFDNALVDHSLGNLRFWCQRCHLRHDAAMRRAARK